MKQTIRLLAILAIVIAVTLTACHQPKASDPTTTAPTAAPTTPTAVPTATPVPQTAIPVPATQPVNQAEKRDAAPEATNAPDVFDAETLTKSSWTLTAVTVNGERQSPAVYYGSIIRQTGATLAFRDDGSFSCVLGGVGCSGDYTVSDDNITLHITTKYTSAASDGESCDERQPLTCDTAAGTLRFDFSGATNEFTIGASY
ncbi:hypothetical protein [Ruminococcus sp.]|uniref:hypothetical protein n=1 Tax=Ruminococcus sp. TaxID=41978 RepID=UPI003890C3E7